MRTLVLVFCVVAVLLMSGANGAASRIQAWPEGWSDIHHITTTGIYGNRFLVHWDGAQMITATVDGLHRDGLSLVVRGLEGYDVAWETVVSTNRRANYSSFVTDPGGRLHLLWQEQIDGQFRFVMADISPNGEVGDLRVLMESTHLIQEPTAAFVNDALHVLWIDSRLGYYGGFHGRAAEGMLQDIQPLPGHGGTASRPTVKVYDDTLHSAWVETGVVETHVYHSEFAGAWTQPTVVGPASAGEGETLAFLEWDQGLDLVWTSVVEGGQSSLMAATYEGTGMFGPWRRLAWGSRARVDDERDPVIVWQRPTPDGHKVFIGQWRDGGLEQMQSLNVRPVSSLRPEVVRDHEGFLHVFWLEAHQELRHHIVTINTVDPRPVSLFRAMGIDDEAPLFHLGFVLLGSVMLSLTYVAMNAAVLILVFLLLSFLNTWRMYRRMPVPYLVGVAALAILVLMESPIAFGQPEFAGTGHWFLSALLAWVGVSLLLAVGKARSDFENVIIPLLWMFWFQVFALIPQALGMV